MQAGCSVFPVTTKPIPEPSSQGSEAKKAAVKETREGPSKTRDNQLLQTANLETVRQGTHAPNQPDSDTRSLPPEKLEDCPVLEVASRVFPGTEKPPISSGVILADLSKPNPSTSPKTADSHQGALGIPPHSPSPQMDSPAASLPDKKSQGISYPQVEKTVATAPSEGTAKANQGSSNGSGPETVAAKPAGEETFHFTKLILCKRVDGFGQYEPVSPGYRFSPGASGFPGERVLLYAEMASPPGYSAEGTFRTNLCGEVEIMRQNDPTAMCKLGFPGREDCSRTARKDHHLVYSFHVPPGLPPGTYTLRVNARGCSKKTGASEMGSPEYLQASAKVDFEVDVGRGPGEGSRDKTLLPAGGGNTK